MNIIPLTIESLVALLLLLTILYCVRLNGQLKRLRADEGVMKEVIADLAVTTERAERAMEGLKVTVADADRDLGDRLRTAELFCADISRLTEAGSDVLERLTRIAATRPALKGEAPPLPPLPPRTPMPTMKPATPDPKAIMAAAQAFTERARARLRGEAA